MFYWTSVIVRNALRLTACSAAIAATLFSGRDAGATPVVQAVRTAAPVIDGVLDEEVWRAGRPVTQFTQNVPNDGEAATEATRVTVVYDDEALYIAAEMDDSAPVTERLGRRDADLDSDWFRVYLDAQRDGRSGFAFFVNPSNVQRDVALFDDTSQDAEWDGVWTSATKTTPGGWTAELRIPLSQLRFPRRREQRWRVNFARQILRKNEVAYFVNVPRNASGFVSRFAELEGIRDLQLTSTVEVRPYATWRGDMRDSVLSDDPVNRRRSTDVDGGVDLSWRPRPNVTFTGAIRPDFGQVEIDPAAINLSEYELFYAEKRPLFLEGASLFSYGASASNTVLNFNITPPTVFYSRRIGRQPQGTAGLGAEHVRAPLVTTILAAGKLTARTSGGWSIGLLEAVTEQETAQVAGRGVSSLVPVEPRTNYFVLRTSKELGTDGVFGTMVTSVIREETPGTRFLRARAWAGGFDGHYRFGAARDVLVEWMLSASQAEGSAEAISLTQRSSAHYYQRPDAQHVEYDPGRTSLSGIGGRLLVARQSGRWRYNLQAQSYSPGYETNDAGFMQRGDITATHAALVYSEPSTTPWFRERKFIVTKFQNWNYDGDLISNGLQSDNYATFHNYMTGALFAGVTWERMDDRATRGGPVVLQPFRSNFSWKVGSDRRRAFWAEAFQRNIWNSEGSSDRGLSVALSYKAARSVTVSLTPAYTRSRTWAQYITSVGDTTATATYGRRYVFGQLDQRIVDLAARIDWAPLRALSIQAYVQPYVASGSYSGIKELARPRTTEYSEYQSAGAIVREGSLYRIDPDGPGAAAPFTIADPDFNFRSLRANVVVRWEYRPGSALYVVWNENRARTLPSGAFDLGGDVASLPNLPADRTLLVKATYRFER